MPVLEKPLSGWGRYPVVESALVRPERRAALHRLVTKPGAALLARGAGRSYGDAALNPGGLTVLTERLDRMLDFDENTGCLRCEAGVLLGDILDIFVPRGWFLPVTPGTRFVSVGGAVAMDVHGKNHHCDGSFGHFVTSFEIMTASGAVQTCSRAENPALFWATLGGGGLTGLITEVTFTLRPIETAYVHTRTIKARDLDDALALFDEYEPIYPYSVAWIDCLSSGRRLGRSLVMLGDHASRTDLDAAHAADPLRYDVSQRLSVPFDLPAAVLNPLSIKAFNALYYGRQRRRDREGLSAFGPFFYPLDGIGQWNRMYGKRGFIQFQCLVPPENGRDALVALLERFSRDGHASFLAVLKRFGPASGGLLSFPYPGYTLSLDIPMHDALPPFLKALNRVVLDYGGRVYLAKDAHLTPEEFRAMYPGWERFVAFKRKIDPNHVFTSSLARRLALTPA